MMVLYVGMRYDYGDPVRGDCYEYLNFVDTLRRMPEIRLEEFYFDVRMRELGRKEMNSALLETAKRLRPDIVLFVLFTDEIARETITGIRQVCGATTVNWFGDDHWRFLPFSRRWAPLFDAVITTDSTAIARYSAIGCHRVIRSQWGFNHQRMSFPAKEEVYDVTFVGQGHGRRREIINTLANHGIDVICWGHGWDNGRLSVEEMCNVYVRSRINLNFTESSIVAGRRRLAKTLLNRRADGTLTVNSPGVARDIVRAIRGGRAPQIKGRNFEVPGAGGFLLTSGADGLAEYFVPDKEIVIFQSVADLEDKIRYYLEHPDERHRIRDAGFQRARRDHTYERRFREIFSALGSSTSD